MRDDRNLQAAPAAASAPHPVDAFSSTMSELDIDGALIVLDTNTLLLPYSAGTESLSDISRIYRLLELKGRLLVPEQVAHEYRKNRAARISDVYKSLGDASRPRASR